MCCAQASTITNRAGLAVHQSVQTVHFVQECHRDSDVLWSTQRQTDGKSAARAADLQQAAIVLGDQVNSLQKQIRLKCDWNVTSFCVTPHKYNESSFHWDKVKQHVLNQGNLSLDINNLQEIMDTFSQKLHLLSSRSNLLEAAADGMSQLNPIPHLKTIGGSMAGFMLIFICLFFFFSVST